MKYEYLKTRVSSKSYLTYNNFISDKILTYEILKKVDCVIKKTLR